MATPSTSTPVVQPADGGLATRRRNLSEAMRNTSVSNMVEIIAASMFTLFLVAMVMILCIHLINLTQNIPPDGGDAPTAAFLAKAAADAGKAEAVSGVLTVAAFALAIFMLSTAHSTFLSRTASRGATIGFMTAFVFASMAAVSFATTLLESGVGPGDDMTDDKVKERLRVTHTWSVIGFSTTIASVLAYLIGWFYHGSHVVRTGPATSVMSM